MYNMRIAEYKKDSGLIYRNATPEEEAAYLAEQAIQEPSAEDRLSAMEDALAELMEVLFDD